MLKESGSERDLILQKNVSLAFMALSFTYRLPKPLFRLTRPKGSLYIQLQHQLIQTASGELFNVF